MRILILSSWHLYPSTHGGKVDTARRGELLAEFGAKLLILSWDGEAVPSGALEKLHRLSPGAAGFIRRRKLRYFFDPRLPYSARGLHWNSGELADVSSQIREFAPELILLEGVFTFGALLQVFPHITGEIPVVLRSQNVEFQYFKILARGSQDLLHRVYHLQEAWRLESFERHVFDACERVFQICDEDRDFWKARGFLNQESLPIPFTVPATGSRMEIPSRDLGFLAAFNSPHKVESLRWFVRHVWPRLPRGLRFSVAGSGAPPMVMELCRQKGIEFLGFVDDLAGFLSSCRVLVIPMEESAGVLVKLPDMIATGSSVVVSSSGLRGYPAEIRKFVDCADTPDEFVAAIERRLREPIDSTGFAEFAERTFGRARQQEFYETLCSIVRSSQKSGERKS